MSIVSPPLENGDDEEEEEERRHDEEEEEDEKEEEEEPVWTASGLIGTPLFPQLLLL